MPYIITRCWYPLHKVDEPAKKYLEVMKKYPPDESIAKLIVPVAVSSTKDGIETMSINEVESQKVGEAYNREARMMVEFKGIKGFSYELKVWSKVDEALDMIGMGS